MLGGFGKIQAPSLEVCIVLLLSLEELLLSFLLLSFFALTIMTLKSLRCIRALQGTSWSWAVVIQKKHTRPCQPAYAEAVCDVVTHAFGRWLKASDRICITGLVFAWTEIHTQQLRKYQRHAQKRGWGQHVHDDFLVQQGPATRHFKFEAFIHACICNNPYAHMKPYLFLLMNEKIPSRSKTPWSKPLNPKPLPFYDLALSLQPKPRALTTVSKAPKPSSLTPVSLEPPQRKGTDLSPKNDECLVAGMRERSLVVIVVHRMSTPPVMLPITHSPSAYQTPGRKNDPNRLVDEHLGACAARSSLRSHPRPARAYGYRSSDGKE